MNRNSTRGCQSIHTTTQDLVTAFCDVARRGSSRGSGLDAGVHATTNSVVLPRLPRAHAAGSGSDHARLASMAATTTAARGYNSSSGSDGSGDESSDSLCVLEDAVVTSQGLTSRCWQGMYAAEWNSIASGRRRRRRGAKAAAASAEEDAGAVLALPFAPSPETRGLLVFKRGHTQETQTGRLVVTKVSAGVLCFVHGSR